MPQRRGRLAGFVASGGLLVTLALLTLACRHHLAAWSLVRQAGGASAERRLEIIAALGETRSPLAVPKLIEWLDVNQPAQSLAALEALASFGPMACEAAPKVTSFLHERPDSMGAFSSRPSRAQPVPARKALLAFGHRAIPAVLDWLGGRFEGRPGPSFDLAMEILSRYPRESARLTLESLAREEDAWRFPVLDLLLRLGDPALPEVAAALGHAHRDVRITAATVLELAAAQRVGPSPPWAVRALGKRESIAIVEVLSLDPSVTTALESHLTECQKVAFGTACLQAAFAEAEAATLAVQELADCLTGADAARALRARQLLSAVAAPDERRAKAISDLLEKAGKETP